tara:strand:- start:117 stop:944 length:828 start_codon:yes stop_codon:yes gene_type:complete
LSKNLIHYNNIIGKIFIANTNVKDEFIFYLKEKLHFHDRDIFVNKEKILTNNQEKLIKNFIEKKKEGIPLDYILNSTKFYEEEFYVDQRVLIPRPETELLVDYIYRQNFSGEISILDAGTGSGCIALSIALKNPKFQVYGSDFCIDSLNVASINKDNLRVDNFHLINSNWLSCFDKNSFDVIVSNPPYINKEDIHLNNLKHEPYQALVASNNGIGDIKTIICQSKDILKEKGILILEHGYNQSEEVNNILEENGFTNIKLLKDFQNLPRVSVGVL